MMTKKSHRQLSDEQPQLGGVTAMLPWSMAVASTLFVPVVMSLRGEDPFRLPKNLLFLTFAIGIAVAGSGAWLCGRMAKRQTPAIRTVPLIAVAAVTWTALASLFSSNHALSNRVIVWVAAVAVFALGVDFGGRTRGMLAIAWPLLPAVVNAAIFLLQRFHLWNPMTFPSDVPDHFRYTALLGNPDDVASLLVAPALVAVALVLCDRPRRTLWIPTAAFLLLAIATGRLTALLACGAGLLTMGFLRSRRGGAIAAALLVAASIALVIGYTPLRERTAAIARELRERNYNEATSGRVTPFLSAAMMARDHPLFGVGPGCFRWRYFDYKLAAERAHPSLAKAWAADYNFGETHNDHLQTLAETGVPGYALFVIALVVLGASSRNKREDAPERERDIFVRTLAPSMAVGVSVLCLAHFPLHLAASTVVIVYIAVLCVAWGTCADVQLPALNAGVAAFTWPRRLPPVAIGAIMVIAALAGVTATWRIAWEPWQCNVMKKAVAARTQLTYDVVVSTFRTSRYAQTNLAELEPCMCVSRDDVGLYMLAAANDRLIGRFDDAATMYRKALEYDKRPELYYNLGLMELALNHRQAAVADLLSAVSFSRSYIHDLPADVQIEVNEALRQRYPYLVGI